jgi:Tfp pilus assembly PilM family ATPase
LSASRTIIGFDWGRYAIKAVWVESSRSGPVVTRSEMLRLPPGNGIVGVATTWIEKLGIKRTPCVIGLSGQQSMFQPFSAPTDDPRTNAQIADMELTKYHDMASETMVSGFAPIDAYPHQRHLLLAMARQSLVETALETARQAGLNVVDIAPTPVAMFNAISASLDKQDPPFLCINIGSASTEIAIGGSPGLLFARSFAVGGQLFTDSIARARKIPAGQAETLKTTTDMTVDAEQSLASTVAPAVSVWVAEIQACLSVYRSLFADRRLQPARAILVGGGSYLKSLPDALSTSLAIPVTRMESLPRHWVRERPGVFATAAGLALGGLGKAPCDISLLPVTLRHELTFRRQKPYWIASGVTAAAILGTVLGTFYWDFSRMERLLRERQQNLRARQQLAEQIESVVQRQDTVQRLAGPVQVLLKSGPAMRDLVTLISEAKHADDWITMIADADSYFSPPPNPGTGPTPPAPGLRDPRRNRKVVERHLGTNNLDRVIIEGYTRTPSFTTVQGLIAQLSKAPFVKSADLIADDLLMPPTATGQKYAAPGARLFVLDVRLTPQ